MSNELALTFEAMPMRMVIRNGTPWWVLADICTMLDIKNVPQVAGRLDNDEKDICEIDTPGGRQQMLIVSEPGFYNVTRTSQKPRAKRLRRFVDHDVLPEIRRTGSYRGDSSNMLQTLFDQGIQLQNSLKVVDAKVDRMEGKVINLADHVSSMRGDLSLLTMRVDDMAPRHKFSANTVRMWVCVIVEHYKGKCPCCRREKIVHDRRKIAGVAEDDHFNGRERNTPQDGWLVCVGCNLRLRDDAAYKEFAKSHFKVFQDNLVLMFGTARKQSARKNSKTVQSKAQPDLFD